jgi:hypothetical protein
MKLSRHWIRLGNGTRPRRTTATAASSTSPEIAKRPPAITNGGIDATANRIARYVEPQTT